MRVAACPAHIDAGPVLLMEATGPALRVMVTLSEVDAQGLFVIVQAKTFAPIFSPLTVLFGSLGLLNVPVPDTTDHVPVPGVAVFALSVVVSEHPDWSVPALAAGADTVTLISTSSCEDAHPTLEIVHLKVFTPLLNPVTPEFGLLGLLTVAPPAITVHVPVPEEGVLPANVAVVAHTI